MKLGYKIVCAETVVVDGVDVGVVFNHYDGIWVTHDADGSVAHHHTRETAREHVIGVFTGADAASAASPAG